MKRKMLAVIAVAAMLAIAGCAGTAPSNDEGAQSQKAQDDIENTTGENVGNIQTGASYGYEIKITEKNQRHLVKSQPPFTMDSSLERANLIRRYQYLNDRNNQHHVYLMDEGRVVAYYVAQGKVSSVNSKLTNDKQIVEAEGCEFDTSAGHEGAGGSNGACYKTVESPQMDGSYGSNGEAIFFFTANGDYVESSLDYVVSEEPMNIQDTVVLKKTIDDSSGNESDGE